MVTVKISETGTGVCSLSGREGDGLSVAFENEAPLFLSWKSFRQLLALRASQGVKPVPTRNAVTEAK